MNNVAKVKGCIKKAMKVIDFAKRNTSETDTPKRAFHFPKLHLVLIASLCSLLLVAAVSTHSTSKPTRSSVAIKLSLEAQSIPEVNTTEEAAPANFIAWQTLTVKSGDSLSILFNRAGLSDVVLHEFLSGTPKAKVLTKLHPGQKIDFQIDDSGQLQAIRHQKSRVESIEFTHQNGSYIDNSKVLKPDVKLAYREATIINSLFLAGMDVGMEQSLIMELASIFGWDIDFALDIRANDNFKLLYEEQFIDGEKIGNGSILAAEFTNQNQTYRAVRYTNEEGDSDYFTPEGKSMRKAFLRTPVDFARISSHFNLKRRHPILNKIRAHKGTDYAAPTGTPIKAAGNGKVIFAGKKGGYGRTVIIKHGQSYKTLYAHMHKYGRGIKTGKKVKQGQIIGYVGMSGLATGPHLHYEFHKNGVVRNPVKVELPKANSVPKNLLADFKSQTQPLVTQMEEHKKALQLALSNANSATN